MKFTEDAFMRWGYDLAKSEYQAQVINQGPSLVAPNLFLAAKKIPWPF